jgi:hypothetical protein
VPIFLCFYNAREFSLSNALEKVLTRR